MKKPAKKPSPSLLLLFLTCALAMSGCAASGRAARPSACPMLPPPPANVMRSPRAESSLRERLFESAAMPTTNSAPAKP